MNCVQLYGLSIETDFPFRSHQLAVESEPDLWFRQAPAARDEVLEGFEHLFTRPWAFPGAERRFDVYRRGDLEYLRFDRRVDFELQRTGISFRLHDEGSLLEVEMLFLSTVLAYWLERAGMIALHASAVVVDDRALGLAADSFGGKSSLAASLMAAGAGLLTDDILPIEQSGGAVRGFSGYPEMKLGPGVGDGLLGSLFEGMEPVMPGSPKRRVIVGESGFGRFRVAPAELGALLLLDRKTAQGTEPRIQLERVPPRLALLELLRFSFAARLVQSAGMAPRRLEQLGDLVTTVPTYRLAYPSGLENLKRTAEVVLHDLQDDT